MVNPAEFAQFAADQIVPAPAPTFSRYVGPILYHTAAGAAVKGASDLYNSYMRSDVRNIANKTKTRTRKRKYKPNKKAYTSAVKSDGVSYKRGSFKVSKRRKRRKKSLKKQIAQVRRLIPKQSTKTFRDFKTMTLGTSLNNENIVWDIECFSKDILDNYAANLELVDSNGVADYTAANTSMKMSNYYSIMLKNNSTTNVNISYAFFVCKDDDNEGPVDSIVEELVDRGYSFTNAVAGPTAATATSSERPRRLELVAGEFHYPLFGGGALRRNWAIHGKVKKATIGPGDSFKPTWSRKNYTYKPEITDQEGGFTHIKGMSVRLVMSMSGDMAHDSSNKGLVGYGAFRVDAEQQRQTTVKYPNPKALRQVVYTDTLSNVNFTTPVHADDKVSGLEQAAS